MSTLEVLQPTSVNLADRLCDTPRGVINTLADTGIGLGVFSPDQLAVLHKTFTEFGWSLRFTHGSKYDGGANGLKGFNHRHRAGGIVLNLTTAGTGSAGFYWPTADFDKTDVDYEHASGDELIGSVTDVPTSVGTVLLFPTHTWHEFGTDPDTTRETDAWFYYR